MNVKDRSEDHDSTNAAPGRLLRVFRRCLSKKLWWKCCSERILTVPERHLSGAGGLGPLGERDRCRRRIAPVVTCLVLARGKHQCGTDSNHKALFSHLWELDTEGNIASKASFALQRGIVAVPIRTVDGPWVAPEQLWRQDRKFRGGRVLIGLLTVLSLAVGPVLTSAPGPQPSAEAMRADLQALLEATNATQMGQRFAGLISRGILTGVSSRIPTFPTAPSRSCRRCWMPN